MTRLRYIFAAAPVVLLMSAGTGYANTVVKSPITINGTYSISFIDPGSNVGHKPTITDKLHQNGKSPGHFTTGPLTLDAPATTPTDFFTATPSSSSGIDCSSRGPNKCSATNDIAHSEIQVTLKFIDPTDGVTDTLTEDGTFYADYKGVEPNGCTNSKGSETDCIVWAGANPTPGSSVTKTYELSNDEYFEAIFYNAQDWSITPLISFGYVDPLFLQNDGSTPVPASLPLFISGLAVLGLLGWRRKRNLVSAVAV